MLVDRQNVGQRLQDLAAFQERIAAFVAILPGAKLVHHEQHPVVAVRRDLVVDVDEPLDEGTLQVDGQTDLEDLGPELLLAVRLAVRFGRLAVLVFEVGFNRRFFVSPGSALRTRSAASCSETTLTLSRSSAGRLAWISFSKRRIRRSRASVSPAPSRLK